MFSVRRLISTQLTQVKIGLAKFGIVLVIVKPKVLQLTQKQSNLLTLPELKYFIHSNSYSNLAKKSTYVYQNSGLFLFQKYDDYEL